MNTVYFVDFDNTVSLVDVWDSIVARFAGPTWEEIVRDYDTHRISSYEFNKRLLEIVRGDLQEVRSFILGIDVDPDFSRFVKLARAHERNLVVLSDGYDFYIEPLLQKAGVRGTRYFSNHMEWVDGRPHATFPHFRPDCERHMANCKCQYLRLGERNLRRVYIGDGVSDICAAEKVDLVYAKADLRRHFERTAQAFRPFETFDDIIAAEFPSA